MFKCLLHHVFSQRDAMWPNEPRAAQRLRQLLVATSRALSESAHPNPNPNPNPIPTPNLQACHALYLTLSIVRLPCAWSYEVGSC